MKQVQSQNHDYSTIKNETEKFKGKISRKIEQMGYEVSHWKERLDNLEIHFDKLQDHQERLETNFRSIKTMLNDSVKSA